MRRRGILLAGAALPFIRSAAAANEAIAGTVTVLYAGSLVDLMDRGIGPAFDTADRGQFRGSSGGSLQLADEIKERLRKGDVFISADSRANEDLMGPLNGDWVSWYVTFAESPLVIGYNTASRFAPDLKGKPWYGVLQEPGIRIGRTDPKLDPKGRMAVDLLNRAERIYKLPNLSHKVLGAPESQEQLFPEEDLVSKLQSGDLDAGFFYSTETVDHNIAAIKLPTEISLSAHYTATVLHEAPNPAGADRFIAFLLGAEGRAIMQRHGLDVMTLAFNGNPQKVPDALRSLVIAAD
jgi:molybdate/tungstate transport system substrate-binding protein